MNRTSKLAALGLAGALSVSALAATPAVSDAIASIGDDQSVAAVTETATSRTGESQVGSPQSSTAVTVKITNNTYEVLTLVDEYKGYGSWKQHFPATIGMSQTVTASASSWDLNGVNLSAHYAAPDGTVFYVAAYVPVAGFDSTVQNVSGPNADTYFITHNNINGYNPTAAFTLGAFT